MHRGHSRRWCLRGACRACRGGHGLRRSRWCTHLSSMCPSTLSYHPEECVEDNHRRAFRGKWDIRTRNESRRRAYSTTLTCSVMLGRREAGRSSKQHLRMTDVGRKRKEGVLDRTRDIQENEVAEASLIVRIRHICIYALHILQPIQGKKV